MVMRSNCPPAPPRRSVCFEGEDGEEEDDFPIASASPVSTASMMLLTEDGLCKAPIIMMSSSSKTGNIRPSRYSAGVSPSCYYPGKKPLKGILKSSKRGRHSSSNSCQGTASNKPPVTTTKSFRRCVSFSCFSNSRWDADHASSSSVAATAPGRQSLPPSALSQQVVRFNTAGGGAQAPPSSQNVSWSSSNKASSSPRRPRRYEAPTTTTSHRAAPMRRPRRMRSHENLFQHKIDFFLEQTANHQKKMEQQEQQQEDGMSKSMTNPQEELITKEKPKDIEELEMSLMSMQKFLVALHSVPDNQKLLQRHMQHQTRIQRQIDNEHRCEHQRQREDGQPEAVAEEENDDDDVSLDCSSCDEDDDDDDDIGEQELNELWNEIRQKQRGAPSFQMMGDELFQIGTPAANASDDDGDDEEEDADALFF